MISLFGSTGFIGKKFSNMYPVHCIERDSNTPVEDTDILYLISTTHNYHVFSEPLLDVETNLIKLIRVLEEFKKTCPNRSFNFVSSWFVYGDTEFPAIETSQCNPKGFYSITKRTAELMVESYCKTFKLKYKIFRLCNVYGEDATEISSKRNALQFLINNIMKNNDVYLYDDGSNIRDFLHVQDVCKAIMLCIDKQEANSIINIGSGNPQMLRPIMEYVISKSKSNSKLINIEPPFFHQIVQVKNMYLNNTKLKNLGFTQDIPIYEGIDKIMEKYSEKNE